MDIPGLGDDFVAAMFNCGLTGCLVEINGVLYPIEFLSPVDDDLGFIPERKRKDHEQFRQAPIEFLYVKHNY